MKHTCKTATLLLLACLLTAPIAASSPRLPETTLPPTKASRKCAKGVTLKRSRITRRSSPTRPTLYQANNQAGVALDLLGQYEEARKHFDKAIAAAPDAEAKSRATRNMAMSYAFSRDCAGAAKYQGLLVDEAITAGKMTDAAGIANELARACLESGDVDRAADWYKKGYDAAMKAAGADARPEGPVGLPVGTCAGTRRSARGNAAEAQKHVAAAKAVLDKGTNAEQTPFFWLLTGYVAFYGGDYKTAVADFGKANQEDPFNVSHDRAGLRETGRYGEGVGGLQEGADQQRAQRDERLCATDRDGRKQTRGKRQCQVRSAK